jgi:hypothetical protein
MADNVTYQSATPATPPSGTIVSADQDSGDNSLVQRVKLSYSADGVSTHVQADADGLLVNLGANNDVTVTNTVTVQGSGAFSISDGGGQISVDFQGQVTEDAASAGGETSVLIAGVRNDSAAAKTSTDGDFGNIAIDSAGRVGIADLGGSITIDDGGSTIGIDDNNSTISIDDNGSSITVDNAGTFQVQVTGSGLTSLQLIDDVVHNDDAAFAASDAGIPMLAVRHDVDAILGTEASGDYTPLQVDANGNLKAWIKNDAGDPVWIQGSVDVLDGGLSLTVDDGGGSLTVDSLADHVDDSFFAVATNSVQMAGFLADETSTDSVDENDGGAARMTLDRKIIVTPQPHTQGGLSIYRSLDVGTTVAQIKGSAGQLYGWYITNRSTSPRYLKFFDALAASVTLGTTTPVMTIEIPGNSTDHIAANALGGMGIAFATGISVAATTGLADSDTTAPTANDVVVNLFYK